MYWLGEPLCGNARVRTGGEVLPEEHPAGTISAANATKRDRLTHMGAAVPRALAKTLWAYVHLLIEVIEVRYWATLTAAATGYVYPVMVFVGPPPAG